MADANRLTFINVSGSTSRNVGKDEATKSKVRSQVMKNLRRKQRHEDQKKFEEAQQAFAGQQNPEMQPNPPAEVSQDNTTSSSLNRFCPAGDWQHSDPASRPAFEHMMASSDVAPASALWSSCTKQIQSSPAGENTLARSSEPHPRVRRDSPRESSPLGLPLSLHGWQVGGSNPFSMTPAGYQKLVAITESYTGMLSEHLVLTHRTHLSREVTRVTKLRRYLLGGAHDELVLFTVRLVYLGHITAMKFAEEDIPICACAKANALHRLQRSIGHVERKPSLILIGAVVLVLTFELIRGGESVEIHFEGLAKLVGLHDSFDEISDGFGVDAVIVCDLILSATSLRHTPRFISARNPDLTNSSERSLTEFYRSSPLLQVESFESLLSLYGSVPQAVIDILNEAIQSTQDLISHARILSTRMKNRPDQHSFLTLELLAARQASATQDTALPTIVSQACRLAGMIYLRAVGKGIPLEDLRNQDDAKHLAALLNETPLTAWRGIPFIYLWVLLTGASAAQLRPERQYLMAELVRFGLSVGLEHMEDFKQILTNFIWLRRNL